MTETYFFNDFIGQKVTFSQGLVSSWVLERKLGEKNDQLTASDFADFQKASGAYGTFLCSRKGDSSSKAVIKIFLQIPYQGWEHASQPERARQASAKLPMAGQEILDALHILTDNHCTSTPALLAHRIEQQSDDSQFVPGGFAVYLLIEHAQGRQLNESIFWNFNRQQRDRVREAVKTAWEKAFAAGIAINPWGLDKIFYDPNTQSVILTGFYGSEKVSNSDQAWSNRSFLAYGLVIRCRGFSFSFFEEPDLSNCKF